MQSCPTALLALAALVALMVSCASLSITNIAPLVAQEDAQLMRGRRLYLTTCVRCHAPEPVVRYTKAEWGEILPEMIADSKLGGDDAAAVTRYVMAFAH